MPTLPTLNLLLTRRFYSMVDEFTAICAYVDQVAATGVCRLVLWQHMTWSYCLDRRYSMSQQKKSILINEQALNRRHFSPVKSFYKKTFSSDARQPEVTGFHSWAVVFLTFSVRSSLWDYKRLAIQLWKRYGKFKEKEAHFRLTRAIA